MAKERPKILYAAYLDSVNNTPIDDKNNIMDICDDNLDNIKDPKHEYIKDSQTAELLTGLVLNKNQIKLINKLNYDEIITLKSAFDKVDRKNVGRKKKVFNVSVETIEELHKSGLTYREIAKKYNVSLSTLNNFLRKNRGIN